MAHLRSWISRHSSKQSDKFIKAICGVCYDRFANVDDKNRISDGQRSVLADVVVTLREINRANRLEDFENTCLANGCFVNRIAVVKRIDIHNNAKEEV